jgi:protein phosphatase
LVALTAVAVIVVGVWVGTQTVYFVGTNADGLVTVYRGVPYDLPAGLHLYSANFVSGVDAAQLSATERHRLLDHTLRSHDDATDLVRRLELGQLQLR